MERSPKKIGMLGGGQLGRMAAIEAVKLGFQVVPYDPNPKSPCFQLCPLHFCAAWDDTESLKRFANEVDVITLEFENVPLKTLQYLETLKPVYPASNALAITQHRIKEKDFLNEIGVPTTHYSTANSAVEIANFFQKNEAEEAILKTCRMGYDGKGQQRVLVCNDHEMTLNDFKSDNNIIEKAIDFKYEISCIAVRSKSGQIMFYDCPVNNHKNGILYQSIIDGVVPENVTDEAQKYTRKIAEALNYTGVLAVEYFVMQDDTLLANEIAPRPHNSGHWTIDACHHNQFEQQVRAALDVPLANTERHSNAVMTNLLGEDILNLEDSLKTPRIKIHDYGKDDIKEGRKMGHITELKDKI